MSKFMARNEVRWPILAVTLTIVTWMITTKVTFFQGEPTSRPRGTSAAGELGTTPPVNNHARNEETLFRVTDAVSKTAGIFYLEPAPESFGNVSSFTLQNLTNTPLDLSVTQQSCGCSSITFQPPVLPPQGMSLANISMRSGGAGPKRLVVHIAGKTPDGRSSSVVVDTLVTIGGLTVSSQRLMVEVPSRNGDTASGNNFPQNRVVSNPFDFAVFVPNKETDFRLVIPERLSGYSTRLDIKPTIRSQEAGFWKISGRASLALEIDDERSSSEQLSFPLIARCDGHNLDCQMTLVINRAKDFALIPSSLVIRCRSTPDANGKYGGSADLTIVANRLGSVAASAEPLFTTSRDDLTVRIASKNDKQKQILVEYNGPLLSRPETRRMKIEFAHPVKDVYEVPVLLIPAA